MIPFAAAGLRALLAMRPILEKAGPKAIEAISKAAASPMAGRAANASMRGVEEAGILGKAALNRTRAMGADAMTDIGAAVDGGVAGAKTLIRGTPKAALTGLTALQDAAEGVVKAGGRGISGAGKVIGNNLGGKAVGGIGKLVQKHPNTVMGIGAVASMLNGDDAEVDPVQAHAAAINNAPSYEKYQALTTNMDPRTRLSEREFATVRANARLREQYAKMDKMAKLPPSTMNNPDERFY